MKRLLVILLLLTGCAMSNSERMQKIQNLQERDIPLSLNEQQNVMLNNHEERIQNLESTNDIDATPER